MNKGSQTPVMVTDTYLPKTYGVNDSSCGPAVAQAVLAKYGIYEGQESLIQKLGTCTFGTDSRVLGEYLATRLPFVERRVKPFGDYLKALAAGDSVILCIQAYGTSHYVCLVGATSRTVYFMDPGIEVGYGKLKMYEFYKRWTDRWALICRGRRTKYPMTTEVDR